ncbi:MAG: threonine--tRNA ligase [Candidatus Micrarchaeia archaeon]|jgi:threonyl-tRNA synthetase
MKELIIHADKVSYETTRKTKVAEEISKEMEKGEMKDVIWARIAVEKTDEEDLPGIAQQAVEDLISVSDQVKCKNVMLYPYAHLLFGSTPSSPEAAIQVIKDIEGALKEEGFNVMRAPFGYYKKFKVDTKGHPLSELSRVFTPGMKAEKKEMKIKSVETEEKVSSSLQKEAGLKSRFYVLTPDGKLVEHEKFNYKGHDGLQKFMTYETKKVRAYEKEPPHIKIMKEHEFVDYEPGTDQGNFRWYPNGRLIKKILEKSITDFCVDYGAMEVETPVMYDFEHPTLKKYLDRFPARQYVVLSDDKKLFLRFAACFGQFLMATGMVISHKHLPLKMYELTRYSFRREQGGELAGLKRLRAFTMPDMHAFCRDIPQSQEEFERQLGLGMSWLDSVGLFGAAEIGFRIETAFYEKNKDWYKRMVKKIGKPVLVEMFDERYAYFITKFEFNFIDSMDKASALTTVQIDVENADTYGIHYVDEDGSKKKPVITHASISGSLERVVYALLEKEGMQMEKGEKAMLPLWLSPTQVRIIPISEKHMEYAGKLFSSFDGVRADIDDRVETLGKKIRQAEKDWVPYVAVVGDKEMETGKLAITVRETGQKKEMKAEELAAEIRKITEGKPFEQLSLPKELSLRPIFHG